MPATRTARAHSSNATTAQCSSMARPSTKAEHIPRPRNCFMIFRDKKSSDESLYNTYTPQVVSKIVGIAWHALTEAEKDNYRALASEEKIAHGLKYPGYKFHPKRREKRIKQDVKVKETEKAEGTLAKAEKKKATGDGKAKALEVPSAEISGPTSTWGGYALPSLHPISIGPAAFTPGPIRQGGSAFIENIAYQNAAQLAALMDYFNH